METQENKPSKNSSEFYNEPSGRVLGGLVVVAVGSVLLARVMGVELPEWLFTWQMIVIAVGIYIGAKHNFRDAGWLIPVAVGVVFLSDRFIEGFTVREYMWPIIIIAIGLSMILKTKRARACRRW
jgi:hypothetical protein